MPSNRLPVNKELVELLPDGFFDLTGSAGAISLAEIAGEANFHFQTVSNHGVNRFIWMLSGIWFRNMVRKMLPIRVNSLNSGMKQAKRNQFQHPPARMPSGSLPCIKPRALNLIWLLFPIATGNSIRSHNSILWCKPQDAPFDKLDWFPLPIHQD